MQLRIGTCGWSFDAWRGPFYPAEDTDQLAFYATRFAAVEIDSTWYHMPSESTVKSWYARTPADFIFCPKLPGEITHEKLLRDCETPVARFTEVIAGLREKLGCVLVQLSPKFPAGEFPRLESFLRALPQTIRYAVEFRHKSWADHPEALELLKELKMAAAMADHPWYPRMEHVTCDFAYLRLLGRRDVFPDYSKVYLPRDPKIAEWAQMLRLLDDGVSRAYVFVNNQFEGHSPATVRKLIALLDADLDIPLPEPPRNEDAQPRLFE